MLSLKVIFQKSEGQFSDQVANDLKSVFTV